MVDYIDMTQREQLMGEADGRAMRVRVTDDDIRAIFEDHSLTIDQIVKYGIDGFMPRSRSKAYVEAATRVLTTALTKDWQAFPRRQRTDDRG